MQFDEFMHGRGIAATPVDRFAGLVVQVGFPPGWEPFNSAPGVRAWFCRSDPCIDEFCANAVLTMHRVATPLDARAVFAMLTEQQIQSVAGCQELSRDLVPPPWGKGAVGTLALQIPAEVGEIASASQTRIITTEEETLIAQLTVTALRDSPTETAGVWMIVRAGADTASSSALPNMGIPIAQIRADD